MSDSDDFTAEQSVEADTHAVLMPIAQTLEIDGWLESFFTHGGRSVLVASRAEEYVSRRIGPSRSRSGTTEDFISFTTGVCEMAGTGVLVAVDADSVGVQRWKHLLAPMPSAAAASDMSDSQLEAAFAAYAEGARRLGVSMFLGPVMDMVSGTNTWLDGRTMIDDHSRTVPVGLRYVHAVQQAGIIATAKYFPGHPHLTGDPIRERVTLTIDEDDVLHHLQPFRALIDGGVAAVMLGPVTVAAIDPESPAGTSRVVVDLLRRDMGFTGLIVSNDLSAESTLVGRSLADAAVSAVAAGVELLLIPGSGAVAEVAAGIGEAVRRGTVSRSRLARAADKIRRMARVHTLTSDAGAWR